MKLFYRKSGTGDPLVILHGLFGSSDNWQTFAKSISELYQVITLDLRNHGLSPHEDAFDYALIAGDILETLDDLQLSQVFLLGHSLGGKAAAFFALKYPDRIKKLVIIDIAPKAYPPHHEIYFKTMRSMDFDVISNRIEADVWMQRDITDAAIRQFLLKNLVRDEQGRFRWRFNLEALYRHYDEINVAITSAVPFFKPCLFIRGAKSSYIQPGDTDTIQSLFPNALIQTIPEAGHWVHADKPLELKEMVLYFLENS